ncbi:hypothetical protein GGS21DRAFT_493860 [Xylaria nigripes]|nr:hypothetical protein GGS21DRAFT_493860 [Xylaria nigripes]
MSFYQKVKDFPRALMRNPSYLPLQEETAESLIASAGSCEKSSRKRTGRYVHAATLALIFPLWTGLTFWLGFRFKGDSNCSLETITWSPARDVVRYEDVEFQGELSRPSPYRGAGCDVDEALDELWMIGGVPIRIDDSDPVVLNKSSERSWTRIPESRGGGIAGYPENMLRMATYPDEYANHTLFAENSPKVVRTHIDHCVEIIRMQLQCSTEMTPILTEDIPGKVFPRADFNVVHKCKNFDELFSWTKENVLHGAGNWDIPKFPDEH